MILMQKTRYKTYNEYVFESFGESFENQKIAKRNQTKGGEKDVKLNRIKAKFGCWCRKLPIRKRKLRRH